MARFVVDLRSNHRFGVFRYGLSLAKELLPIIANGGNRAYVLCERSRAPEVRARIGDALMSREVELVTLQESSFVRDEPDLRNWVRDMHFDAYYATNYVVDPELRVPILITIHDLIRFTSAANTYTDSQFVLAFGRLAFERLKQHHARLFPDLEATTHGCTFRTYFEGLTRMLIQRAAAVATVSRYSGLQIERFEPAVRGKLTIVPGGVDKSIFKIPSHPINSTHLSKLGLSNVPFCVYAGVDKPHKRLPEFIRAFAQIINHLPNNGRLVLVGANPLSTQTQAMIKVLGLSCRIQLLGYLDDACLADLYSHARAVCLPSSEEGYGLSIAEATACGVPVIAADLPVYGETIGTGGHYFPLDRWDVCGNLLIEAFHSRLPAALPAQTSVRTWSESAVTIATALNQIAK